MVERLSNSQAPTLMNQYSSWVDADDASAPSTPSAQTELFYKILDSMSAWPADVRANEAVMSHHFFVMWKNSGVFAGFQDSVLTKPNYVLRS